MAESPIPTRWEPRAKITETIGALAGLQDLAARDLAVERSVAKEANGYVHERDTQDFMICAEVVAGARFWSRYLPKAELLRREDFLRIGLRMCNNSHEELFRLEQRGAGVVQSYFVGFALGTELGWPDEMGEKWLMHFADQTGSFYIPVDEVVDVLGTGF